MALAGFLFFLTAACAALQTCGDSLPAGPRASVSTVWSSGLSRDIILRSVPGNGNHDLSFAAGFYCVSTCDAVLFAVYITSGSGEPVVVWSANRDHAVQDNATLIFTSDGNLVLQDADGSVAWSTDTSGNFVVGMTITDEGNLVLFDDSNVPVWQSFEHPTDSLLPGQQLAEGMRLAPNASATNWTTSSQFYLTVRANGLIAFAGSDPPLVYYRLEIPNENITRYQYRPTCVTLVNGGLSISGEPPGSPYISLPLAHSLQHLRFESDGHLRLYEWQGLRQQWLVAMDVFRLDFCEYPTACGEYGICSSGEWGWGRPGRDGNCSTGECYCPNSTYFRHIDNTRPYLGYVLETPISCQAVQDHQLIAVNYVSYFQIIDPRVSLLTDEESCKKACLSNCSCKAALFTTYENPSTPHMNVCYLLPQVLSLTQGTTCTDISFSTSSTAYAAYLKVQATHSLPPAKKTQALGYALGGAITAFVIFAVILVIIRWRRNQEKNNDDKFPDLPGMPTRFTFELLKAATDNFSSKLGEGGFGSVFQGQLGNDMVAVKLLDRAA